MTGSANANFGTCGNDSGNIGDGNDGGKRESTFAAPVFAPMVIVLVAKVVNFVVIVIAAFVIGVSVKYLLTLPSVSQATRRIVMRNCFGLLTQREVQQERQ